LPPPPFPQIGPLGASCAHASAVSCGHCGKRRSWPRPLTGGPAPPRGLLLIAAVLPGMVVVAVAVGWLIGHTGQAWAWIKKGKLERPR
jgi:hypothetical protein